MRQFHDNTIDGKIEGERTFNDGNVTIHSWHTFMYCGTTRVDYEEYSCSSCGQHLGTKRNGQGILRDHKH